jgi:hypothetical protein
VAYKNADGDYSQGQGKTLHPARPGPGAQKGDQFADPDHRVELCWRLAEEDVEGYG